MSFLDTVKDYFNAQTRPLTPTDIRTARRVFQDTVPSSLIMISDDLEAGSSAWMEPGLELKRM